MKNEVNKAHTTFLDNITKTTIPVLYQVVVQNDDFTPMEFVMDLLEKYFYMDRHKAAEVMLQAHVKGSAICGIFSKDVAEAKVVQAIAYARSSGHPLHCNMEVAR